MTVASSSITTTARTGSPTILPGPGGTLPINRMVPGGGTLPKGMQVGTSGYVYPFPIKNLAAQFRRLDQGVDLQFPGTNRVPVRALAPGVININTDPGGFGTFPVETLRHAIAGYNQVYYGHVIPAVKAGTNVRAGQIIAYTGGRSSGGNAAGISNWLEEGFTSTAAPFAQPMGGPQSQAMLNILRKAQTLVKAKASPKPLPPRTLPLLPGPVRPKPTPTTPRYRLLRAPARGPVNRRPVKTKVALPKSYRLNNGRRIA